MQGNIQTKLTKIGFQAIKGENGKIKICKYPLNYQNPTIIKELTNEELDEFINEYKN